VTNSNLAGGRCATCKHWYPFGSTEVPSAMSPGFKNTYPADDNKLGLCGAIVCHGGHLPEKYRVNGEVAQVEDMSGECALRTAATFGCILHESK
jgi:hypothetical protein